MINDYYGYEVIYIYIQTCIKKSKINFNNNKNIISNKTENLLLEILNSINYQAKLHCVHTAL